MNTSKPTPCPEYEKLQSARVASEERVQMSAQRLALVHLNNEMPNAIIGAILGVVAFGLLIDKFNGWLSWVQ